jgi:uncharacterized membrane protein
MRLRLFGVCSGTLVLAAIGVLAGASHAATLQWVGSIGGLFTPGPVVSGDGSTVAYSDPASHLVRWTSAGGNASLWPWGLPHGLSADGSMIVGEARDAPSFSYSYAFRWNASEGVQPLPLAFPLLTSNHWAIGVSADGSRIAGNEYLVGTSAGETWWQAGAHGWADGSQDTLPFVVNYVAEHISADGNMIVGTSYVSSTEGASLWRFNPASQEYERTDLGSEPGGDPTAAAHSVDADGSIVVGTSNNETSWSWTLGGGMTPLQGLAGFTALVLDISGSGSRIVGYGNGSVSLNYRALVWNGTSAAPRTLEDILTNDDGLDLAGANLLWATSVSADGNTIVGIGYQPGQPTYGVFRANLSATAGVASGPSGPRPLSIRRSFPNPARDRAQVAFTLGSDRAATLELVDLSGRTRMRRDIRSSGGGEQFETLPLSGLPVGLYWVRVSQGARSVSARIAVVR